MITRFMDLQMKQGLLFRAYRKCSDPKMKEIWDDKLKHLQRIIQNISIDQAREDIKNKENHILKAMGIEIRINKKGLRKVYFIDTSKKVSYCELAECWRLQ